MKRILLFLLLPVFVYSQNKQITVEDIYKKNTFGSQFINGFRSMNDGKYYSETDSAGNIVKTSIATGLKQGILLSADDVKDEQGKKISLDDYQWSKDETKLIISKNRESIYRRSSKAIVYVYDLIHKTINKVDNDKILHATLSPDASKIAFVKENNLFVKDLATNTTTQITDDGKMNAIINGNCDWVYEEEFAFTKAFQWSKKGTYLAYYRFDESKVPVCSFPMYTDSLYTTQFVYKYPKVGETNSSISLFIYNVNKETKTNVELGNEKDIYIPRIQFTEQDNKLCVFKLNRLQNNLQLSLADANTGLATTLYTETSNTYVDINKMLLNFLKDGKSFVYTSEKDGFKHIYIQNITTGKYNQLTSGKYDVNEIIGIDENKSIVYFSAAYRSPLVKDFCSVHLDGKDFKLNDAREGKHAINFTADYSYYVDDYSTINTPPYIAIYDNSGKQVRLLTENNKLKQILTGYTLGTPEFIKVLNRNGDTLNGMILKPKDFDATKKYPVLFSNYGGPGSQTVYNGWGAINMWQQMLAQKGYIIVSIDNTGTGFRGEAFKKKTYLQMGKYEIEDQIDAAKYFATLPYVDANRIGHWGWSFGGFMSCLAITKGADIFKTAIAVAPVTDWQYYDDVYTERYMRTQKENSKGYHDNAPLNFVKNIKGKLLIIHGTADDNVHFQNSVMFVDEMIKNNIDFESAYYPNKNHGIRGGNTRLHLYNKMTKFILQNL